MIFKGAAAIGLVELRTESFVLQHDVENVAQHFKSDDLGFRDDGSGSRIKIHTSHFAEEVAGAELGDGIPVSEINGGVDGNGSVERFFRALVFFARDERASQPLEKSFCTALRLDVRDGSGDGGGIAHRRIEIESDAGGIAFAHAAEDEIAFDLVAATDAAVAENASVVVHGDGQGRIVFAVSNGTFRKTRLGSAGSSCK